MVERIIRFSLENKLTVLIVTVLIIIGGVYSLEDMNTDVFPDLNAPTVVVMTEAGGMAPEEIEKLVTFPIETAVNGSTGLRRVRSSSAQGYSIVWVEFDWGMDIYNARQIVAEKLQLASNQLPKGVGAPTLMPQSSLMGEIIIMAMTADSTSMLDLRTIAEWNIRPRLLSVNGVAEVNIYCDQNKEYQVIVDGGKMGYYGVTIDELRTALESGVNNVSGGYIEDYGNRYNVRGIGRTSDPNIIADMVIKSNNGVPIKISNVAEVKIGSSPVYGSGAYNGKEAAIVVISKQPNLNTITLTENIEKAISELQLTLPSDIKIHNDIFSQSTFINNSVSNVSRTLYEGGILVTIVLLIFLMNIRITFISLVSIPLSLLITIIVLKLLGMGINTMVLGGMAIAIGSLVDDAIVDVENVYKRLRENAILPESERKPKVKIIYTASLEIRSSIVNATLIIIAAFLPLFFLTGMEGMMLMPLGLTYIISLFASLLIAMTLTNVLEVYLLNDDKMLVSKANGSKVERWLKNSYGRLLEFVLRYRKSVIYSVIVLFIGSLSLAFSFGRSFLPAFNEGTLTISVSTVAGVSYEESLRVARQSEKAIMSIPEISIVERRTGRAELAEHSADINVSEIDAPYTLTDRTKDEMLSELRVKLDNIAGINYEIGQPLSHRINSMISGTRSSIAIKLFGNDLQTMYKIGKEIESKTSEVEGLVDVMVEQQTLLPQIKITAKQEALAYYGISMPEFLEHISAGVGGEEVATVFEGERSFPLVIRFQEEERGTHEQLKNSLISSNKGTIPFHYIADIISSSGPNTINRENVRRRLVVSANVSGRDVGSVVKEMTDIINTEIDLPEEYYVEYGGEFESEARASRTLFLTSFLSILIIFVLLYQEFKNVQVTGIILLNLPLALIGGIIALKLTSSEINIPAIIGGITLFGIATRNGILLVSRYQALQEEGMYYKDIIIKGSVDRIMPITMTALTAALALIPMAMAADQPGNEIQSPMAIVILGGLISSTILNIIILPIVFWIRLKPKGE